MKHEVTFELTGNEDAIRRVVRRMLDDAGFTGVSFVVGDYRSPGGGDDGERYVHRAAPVDPNEPHVFVRGKFEAGSHGRQMPDETCDVCGLDPRNLIHANNTKKTPDRATHAGPVWVGYRGPTDPRTEDYARRRFRLGDMVPRDAILTAMRTDHPAVRFCATWTSVLDAIADLELEVSTALVTENTNGETCANAWVKCVVNEPEFPPDELDRSDIKTLAETALHDLESRQAPKSVRGAVALLVELANGRTVIR